MKRVMLLTQENRRALPALYSQDGKGEEAIAHVKLFHPLSRYTYYVTEFDPDNEIMFGWCVSPRGADCDEFGYAALSELTDTLPRGLPFERDRSFTPMTVAEARRTQA